MNKKYEFHKSSILGMDANIVSLLVYLLPFVFSVVLYMSNAAVFSWLIPLIVIIMEKDSKLVKFHAWQAFLMDVFYGFIFGIITGIGIVGAIFSIFASNIGGFATAVFFIFILGIIFTFISILQVIAAIKAYGWIAYRLPFVGNWAKKISHEND